MKPDPARTSAPRREEGIALVVVLLFTAVVLTTVVSTTATLALGARGGGVNERAAYQALLAAESGLNTFEVRYAAKMESLPVNYRLRGEITAEQFNAWLQNNYSNDLTTYTTGTGETITLTFNPSSSSGGLTLVATGSSGTSKKIVLQNYKAEYMPAFNIRSDAPLVSYPNVDVRGGAQVIGQSVTASTGMTPVARVNEASNIIIPASTTAQPFSMDVLATLSTRLLLRAGDYVQIANAGYEVIGLQGEQVTLMPLTAPSAEITIPKDAPINRLDSAVTSNFQQASGTNSTFPVSDPTFFVQGSKVQVGSMLGTVKAINDTSKVVEVVWDVTSPARIEQVPRGTPVKREVKSVASGYGVSGDDQALPNGSSPNDSRLQAMNPFNTNANPDLFTHTFGQTKNQMLAATPYQGWVQPVSNFNGAVNGITFVNESVNLSGKADLCGTGILIVRGNLTVNGTCNSGFRGLVYVLGDYDQQGNSTIVGSVIAEGSTQIDPGTECVPDPDVIKNGGNNCDTKIAGTDDKKGPSDGKIRYDRAALLEVGSLLSPPTFKAVQGTWRQQ